MRVPEDEGSRSPYWRSSTNWLVADGSLEGSISFETSSSEGADVIPIGVLLERPADLPPCEITIFFRERHEIHSIYVRSSARVYEVYYASDSEVSSNEYLCTVRCGAAVQEVTQDMCERVLAEDTIPDDINADFPRSNTSNVMEDGWVEVEVSDSLRPDNNRPMPNISVENICPKTQIQYEATAEISDASPCISITLRLLSLQIKTSIHIDEIYIYADPVEDTDPDPPVSNVGAGSLLSMLVPSLLQLSKSGTSRLQDKGFSNALAGPKHLFSTEGAIHATFPDKFEMSEVAASSMMGKSNVGLDQQYNEEKLEHPLLSSRKIVSDPDQASKTKTDENNGVRGCVENLLNEPVVRHTQTKPGDGNLRLTEEEKGSDQSRMDANNETNASYVRLEKILDDLVLRMGKIENFCVSFQESILKPLTGIERRLQRMEEQLDAFSKAPLSSEAYPSTVISRLSAHESSFENKGCKSSSALVDSSSLEKEASVDLLMLVKPESEKISGLVVKAPEFPDDDDDDDDDESNISYSVDLTPNEYPKKSIDSALASALASFITSTTDKSSLPNSHPMDVPNEQQNCSHHLDSAAVAVHSEADRISVSEWFLGDRNGDLLYEVRDEKMCQSEKSSSDVLVPDSTLNKFDMIDKTGPKVQGNCLYDKSPLADDDSSAEIETHESKGLIVRAPEFPNEDDILDCGENAEPHVSNYSNVHSHALPHSRSTPLALFLSSRKVSPLSSSSNAHDEPLKLSTSDRNSFSLSTFQTKKESDGMRKSSLENYLNTAVESSIVGCFLSQSSSPQQVDIFHDPAVVGEENLSFIRHNMEDANHVLNCDGFHLNGMSKGCTSDLLGEFEAADCSAPLYFDEIVISGASQMKSLFEPKQISSFIPCKDDLTSNVKFYAETNLKSWLPHEILLGVKQDDEPKKDGQLKPVQEYLVSNLEFSLDRNLRSGLPLEVLLDENPYDQVENSDYGKQHNSPPAQEFKQNCEIIDNTLFDIEGNAVQSEISSMVTPGTPHYPVCFSSENLFSSLI